jgi:hypothetical protein
MRRLKRRTLSVFARYGYHGYGRKKGEDVAKSLLGGKKFPHEPMSP